MALFAPALEELHSCGATSFRGIHESSPVIPLHIEGEGGTHHSSKDREKEENTMEVRKQRVVK